MSTFKGTPGPWTTDGEGIHMLVRGRDATIVAVRHRHTSDVHTANFKLVAASFDVLAALRETASMLQAACMVISDPEARTLALEAVANARAAIAKAGA